MAQEPGAQRTIRARDENGDPQRLVGCRVALIATDGVEQAELEEPGAMPPANQMPYIPPAEQSAMPTTQS